MNIALISIYWSFLRLIEYIISPKEPQPRELQPNDISFYESFAIVFYEVLYNYCFIQTIQSLMQI